MKRILALSLTLLPLAMMAQKVGNMRAYDQRGVNVFEDPKDSVQLPFDDVKVKIGAGFTQQFQHLKHENPGSALTGTTQKLKPLASGFQLAQANLFIDVQLAEGIRLNVTSYMSAKHHNDFWVKGGFIQFDKLPFEGKFWDDIMKLTTIKIGHYEQNYGDAHFRRSDGGQTLWNPFMESYLLDAFTTEIGGEVLVRKNGLFGMLGLTGGSLRGGVDPLTVEANPDGNLKKQPSLILKVGYDKQLTEDFRVRVSASHFRNESNGVTLYSGDRTGSNYQAVMELANYNNTAVQGTGQFTSGRLNPSFGKAVKAYMFNGFAKYQGLEFFGTYEMASGRNANESKYRDVSQYAGDLIYRFLPREQVFVGARYNAATMELPGFANDVKVDRTAFAAGWFLTRNVLLKGEYVIQKYKDFPTTDSRADGKFNGYVIEAVVGF